MNIIATFDPASLFAGTGDTLLGYVADAAPVGIPVLVGLLGFGIVIRVIKRVAKG